MLSALSLIITCSQNLLAPLLCTFKPHDFRISPLIFKNLPTSAKFSWWVLIVKAQFRFTSCFCHNGKRPDFLMTVDRKKPHSKACWTWVVGCVTQIAAKSCCAENTWTWRAINANVFFLFVCVFFLQDQYEFVHLVVSEMLTNYLKEHGGRDQLSSLSKSLLSKNYENVQLLQPAPRPRGSSENNLNYVNVAVPGVAAKGDGDAGARTSRLHPTHPKPAIQPRNVVQVQARRLSSFEPLEHSNVMVQRARSDVSAGRKSGGQLDRSGLGAPPPKPSLPVGGLGKILKDGNQPPLKPVVGSKPTIPADSLAFAKPPQVKPKPSAR